MIVYPFIFLGYLDGPLKQVLLTLVTACKDWNTGTWQPISTRIRTEPFSYTLPR